MLKIEHAHETLRDRGKRAKLERIERAARRLFRERGYDATTTRAIAEAARIGTGTLFVYFPEKLDLLVHVYQRDLARTIDEALAALPPAHPLPDACARVFDALYELYAQDVALARTFVKELMFLAAERQAEMLAMTVRFHARLAGLVAAAQARGEVRADVGAPLVAHQLFGIYYWGLVNWLSGPYLDRAQTTAVMRMSLDLVMRGAAGGAFHGAR